VKGRLIVSERSLKTGKKRVVADVENMILDNMYEQFIKLLGGTGNQAYLSRMLFGTGNDAPDATQNFLSRPITPAKDVITVVDAPNFSVTASASLLSNEANGFPISEAGLLTFDNVLVTRAIFDTRMKTKDFVFDFQWVIYTKAP